MWVCSWAVVLERAGVERQEGVLKENMLVGLHLLILLLFSISFSGVGRQSKSALMELPLTQNWEHFSVWAWKSSRHQEGKELFALIEQ